PSPIPVHTLSLHDALPIFAPITGPMYQLFIFFMITDPKTTVRSRTGQCIVVFAVALLETVLRLYQSIYAPYYALFIVGPTALLRSEEHTSELQSRVDLVCR